MAEYSLWLGLATALLAAAAYLWHYALTMHSMKKLMVNHQPLVPSDGVLSSLFKWLYNQLVSVGLPVTPASIKWILLCVLAGLLSYMLLRPKDTLLYELLALCLLLWAVFRLSLLRQRRLVVDQLLSFIEQLKRDVGSGLSIELAFRRTVGRTQDPLYRIMKRVLVLRDRGIELDEAIAAEAKILKTGELQLLAVILQINKTHGGEVTQPMASLIKYLRQRSTSSKELKAMTGETRVTAFVLAMLPLLVSGMLFAFNPDFGEAMLVSEGGRKALMLSGLLQATGIFVLWRMLRSI